MPYVTRSNEVKAKQDADLEATAEANKQEWLAKARRQLAEDDVRDEMMHDATEEVDAAPGLDAKSRAEALKLRQTAIEAQLAKWRADNEWPLTKAERAARDADLKAKADAAQAKMDAEAKANVAKAAKPHEAAKVAPKTFFGTPKSAVDNKKAKPKG